MNNTMYCSNATTTGTGVVLIPNREVKTLRNCGNYRMIICCNVEATANEPVFIQTALGNIPVLCSYGNTIWSSQLQKRRCYVITYGDMNDNYTLGQFVIRDKVCPNANVVSETKKKIMKGD